MCHGYRGCRQSAELRAPWYRCPCSPPSQSAFWHGNRDFSKPQAAATDGEGVVRTTQLQRCCGVRGRGSEAPCVLRKKLLRVSALQWDARASRAQRELVTPAWRGRKRRAGWECVRRLRVLLGFAPFSHGKAVQYYRWFASLLTDDVTSLILQRKLNKKNNS